MLAVVVLLVMKRYINTPFVARKVLTLLFVKNPLNSNLSKKFVHEFAPKNHTRFKYHPNVCSCYRCYDGEWHWISP